MVNLLRDFTSRIALAFEKKCMVLNLKIELFSLDAGHFSCQDEFFRGLKNVYRWRPMSWQPGLRGLGSRNSILHQRVNAVLQLLKFPDELLPVRHRASIWAL